MITEFALVITALSHTSLITLLSQLSLVIRAISTRWASANITLAPRAITGATAGSGGLNLGWLQLTSTGAMFSAQTPAAIHFNMELDM